MVPEVQLNIQLTDLDLNDLDTVVSDTDGVDYESGYANVDPVTGAIIIGATIAGAKLVVRLWNEYRGGTVVDSTKRPIQIRRDRALSCGVFLLIAKDGTVKVEAKDEPKDSLERMVEAFMKLGLGATTDAAKKIVSTTLGQE